MRSTILCLVAVTAMRVLAPAQGTSSKEEAKRAEVLVLGVYHMANPGRDIFNMQADDVLSPKRQQEIAELAAVLKKFKPTKIASSLARRKPICSISLRESGWVPAR